MKRVVDIVNFNADASCLECRDWFQYLRGGTHSTFYNWLNLYVELNKKVVLGIPGATLADIFQFNPDSIELITSNPDIFELVLRPFAHDNALLRTRLGFEKNLEFGIKTMEKLFGDYPRFFLPPEFMLNSEQVHVLSEHNIEGTFVSPTRFSEEAKSRIPVTPYTIRGVLGAELKCLPFEGKLTKAFLDGIHFYNCSNWNQIISNSSSDLLFNWRDGESAFLIPNTVDREGAWLEDESVKHQRAHLANVEINYTPYSELEGTKYKGYPFHSFAPWLKEMRMIGFTNKVAKIEELLDTLSEEKIFHWLQLINSDMLSAVEKESPEIQLQESKNDSEK